MSKRIAQVVFGLPIEKSFDYLIPGSHEKTLDVGSRVYVPFGRRNMVGFVVALRTSSKIKNIKPVLTVLDNAPVLGKRELQFTKRFSEYYGCSWGEAIETSLPPALRKKTSLHLNTNSWADKSKRVRPKGKASLCLDLGREGRWPLILKTVKTTLAKGKSVIFLVPEAALCRRVYERLKDSQDVEAAVLDKKFSAKKEAQIWAHIKEGRARLVIGTRSAAFAPAVNLGLVVIYEEDNPAYKQEQTPSYHVRQVIRMRNSIEGNDILYVSSAPSVETYWEMKKDKGAIKRIPAEHLPGLQAIDLANYKPKQKASLSFPLQVSVDNTLLHKGKTLLFLNKKGFSTRTQCNQCGTALKCKRCNVHLTYMYTKRKLVCRLCGAEYDQPKICPECNSSYLRSSGGGIEKVESNISRLFPSARVEKFDRDTQSFPLDADIVIATQAILKEDDRFKFDLIGVLDMDTELNRTDFRSSQRAFSLLIRLRQLAKQTVMVQTYQPDNYCIRSAVNMDIKKFYSKELKFRRELNFPPYHHLVAIMLRGPREEKVFEQARDLFAKLKKHFNKTAEILDPQPDFQPKLRDKYRYTIMVKGRSVKGILSSVKRVLPSFRKRGNIITVNVDP